MEFNIIVVSLLFVICIYLLSTISKLKNRVKFLEYKLKHHSHTNGSESPINNELRQLLNEGNDVKAVKQVRETLGLSLIEAKQYVDSLKLEGK